MAPEAVESVDLLEVSSRLVVIEVSDVTLDSTIVLVDFSWLVVVSVEDSMLDVVSWLAVVPEVIVVSCPLVVDDWPLLIEPVSVVDKADVEFVVDSSLVLDAVDSVLLV